nr:GATA zinc finger domain-containing protein 14-like isoform X3 [Crassostrea gigas]
MDDLPESGTVASRDQPDNDTPSRKDDQTNTTNNLAESGTVASRDQPDNDTPSRKDDQTNTTNNLAESGTVASRDQPHNDTPSRKGDQTNTTNNSSEPGIIALRNQPDHNTTFRNDDQTTDSSRPGTVTTSTLAGQYNGERIYLIRIQFDNFTSDNHSNCLFTQITVAITIINDIIVINNNIILIVILLHYYDYYFNHYLYFGSQNNGQSIAAYQIQSNNSRRNHSNYLVMNIAIATFAGQNNGQSIVINSIQSNNFLGDNQMNDHMINITIGTLAVQTDAIWQIINTHLNFGHFLSNTIPTLIIETNGRNIATNSIHDQSNNFTGNENTRARPIHLSRSIIPDDPESDHLINEKTEKRENNDIKATFTIPNNGRNIATNCIHDQSNNFISTENTRARPIHLSRTIIPDDPESDHLIHENTENYNNNDNNMIPILSIQNNGRNIATNSIHDQSNNFINTENTRAGPIHLSRTIIPDDPESDHLINENTENYYNNDNTQSLDDIDEIGLGVILNIRVEDVDFS